MNPFVTVPAAIMGERFPTMLTRVRFFSAVNSFMDKKVIGANEGFSTLLTHIRPLPAMDSFMVLEG